MTASAPTRPNVSALKATLVGGIAGAESLSTVAPLVGTLRGMGQRELTRVDVDATLTQEAPTQLGMVPATNLTAAGGRTTVLPRRKKSDDEIKLAVEQRPRFDRVRTLGEGAMGQVEL